MAGERVAVSSGPAPGRGLVRLAPGALPAVRPGAPRLSPDLALVGARVAAEASRRRRRREDGCPFQRSAAGDESKKPGKMGSAARRPAVQARGSAKQPIPPRFQPFIRFLGLRETPRPVPARRAPITSPPVRPIPPRGCSAFPARPDDVTTRPANPNLPRPRGPATLRSTASFLEQSRGFSEPLSHGEGAPRRRSWPTTRRGKAESRRRS